MNKLIKVFVIVVFSLLSVNSIAQYIISEAPVNKNYLKFKESKATSKYGYIPSPMTWFYSNQKESGSKDLPATFDLRTLGYVSSVKNQGSFGTCWSFGTMANLESNWLMNDYGSFDLSEENMTTCHDFVWPKDDGGNKEIATAYLTRLDGPISESDDPYSLSSTTCKGREYNRVAYITEARFPDQTTSNLKNAVKDHGATPISIYWDDTHYNASENTYYYKGSESSNHTVTVVGWDDNMATGGGTGAWIVKNSWGASWGEDGYFYLAYQDTHSAAEINYFPERKEVSEYDKLFMYDKFGAISSIGFGSEVITGLVKYTADKRYRIPAIGLYVSADVANLTIGVYSKFESNVLSENLCEINESVSDPGYYSFDLPEIYVEGDFYVKVKYQTPGVTYPIPVESKSLPDFCVPIIEKGKCWLSPDGSDWYQIGVDGIENGEVDLCIRAYAKSASGTNVQKFSDGGLKVYPNPSEGNITISVSADGINKHQQADIRIYSLSGQEIYSENIDPLDSSVEIELRDKIPTGVYILKVKSDENFYSEKLIIR